MASGPSATGVCPREAPAAAVIPWGYPPATRPARRRPGHPRPGRASRGARGRRRCAGATPGPDAGRAGPGAPQHQDERRVDDRQAGSVGDLQRGVAHHAREADLVAAGQDRALALEQPTGPDLLHRRDVDVVDVADAVGVEIALEEREAEAGILEVGAPRTSGVAGVLQVWREEHPRAQLLAGRPRRGHLDHAVAEVGIAEEDHRGVEHGGAIGVDHLDDRRPAVARLVELGVLVGQVLVDADVLFRLDLAAIDDPGVGHEIAGPAVGEVGGVEAVDPDLEAPVLVGEKRPLLDLVVGGPGIHHRVTLDHVDVRGEAPGEVVEDPGQEHEEAEVEDQAARLADELRVARQPLAPAFEHGAAAHHDAVAQRDVHQDQGHQEQPRLVDREEAEVVEEGSQELVRGDVVHGLLGLQHPLRQHRGDDREAGHDGEQDHRGLHASERLPLADQPALNEVVAGPGLVPVCHHRLESPIRDIDQAGPGPVSRWREPSLSGSPACGTPPGWGRSSGRPCAP